jgi:8-oxo-dGTP pyrophosphatase MutT (NUDIX family)
MSDWKTSSSEVVYETAWIKVHRDEVLNHNGKPLTYSYVELVNPSVFVVVTDDKGRVFLQRNYRYTLDTIMWELPAGYSEEADPLAGAKRELMEEAGLESDDWSALGTLYQANGVGKFPLTVYLAYNARPGDGERDLDEQLSDQTFIDFDEVEAMISRGEIIESAHIAALYLAKLHGLTKEEKV